MLSLSNLFESKLPLRYRVEVIIRKGDQMKYKLFSYDKAIEILKDESVNFEDKKRLDLFKKE